MLLHPHTPVRQLERRHRAPFFSLRRAFLCLVCAALLLSTTPVSGIVQTTITITKDANGADLDMGDWYQVLSDPTNVVGDPFGDSADDPDHNRDIVQAAATWDTNNLYLLFRRASIAGDATITFVAWVDIDGDYLMESTDRVLYYSFTGVGTPDTALCYSYVPDVATGDPMPGDNTPMPGGISKNPIGGTLVHARDVENIECEASIDWTTLTGGVVGAPVNLKFACASNPKNIAGTGDSTDVLALLYRSVSLTPSHDHASVAATDVVLPHTLTNLGNSPETFDLSADSPLGWPAVVTDDGVHEITSIALAAHGTTTIYLRATVPPETPDGTRESITVQASSAASPSVLARVVDRIYVGALLVIPDNQGSMAPGQTITYQTSVRNNSSTDQTITIDVSGDQSWPAVLTGGLTSTETVIPANTTLPLSLYVTVPSTATVGAQERTVVRAALTSAPAVYAQSLNFTTAQDPLTLTPERTVFGGDSTYAYMRHTVRNSTSSTQIVSVAASTPAGWPTATLGTDASTPITTLTVGPNGATADFYVRVFIPAGTTTGHTETVTVGVSSGSYSDTINDYVHVTRLTTYDSPGWTNPTAYFALGDTVFGRAMGMVPSTSVVFNWRDASGTLIASDTRLADAQGTAWASCVPSMISCVGTCTVESVIGGVSTVTEFYVSYDTLITDYWATDILTVGGNSDIGATLKNDGSVDLPTSSIDYLVWWDADASGGFNNGDFYITTSSVTATYTGGPLPVTSSGVVPTLTPSASYADSWLLNNLGFTKGGTWQVSIAWSTDSGAQLGTASTSFYSAISAMNITVSAGSVGFGTVQPEDTGTVPITITVNSTKTYDFSSSYINGPALGLSTTLAPHFGELPGNHVYSDNLSVTIPWGPEGLTTSQVLYTVVAQ